MASLPDALGSWAAAAAARVRAMDLTATSEDVGRVLRVADGVATVEGLAGTRLGEILLFCGGVAGLAVVLDEDSVGCVLLGPQEGIVAGSEVSGTSSVARVPVGDALLGRIVDPLGRPLDGRGAIDAAELAPVEAEAPTIVDRAPVTEPLRTGSTLIDAMLPLGRGQRELIVGDHATGKTSIAIDAILAQKTTDVVSVYCAIGQKSSSVSAAIDAMQRRGAWERCLAVVAAPDAAAGLQWLAPYAACAMAEHFARRGRHALLVLDDLTKHAQVHRQISLLLRQPPGREAYPGDVFYLHSRLLERACRLTPELGGGTLTVLPIAETQAGNLSAYIPTNLVSITDGQILCDPRLFNEGIKPAIDVGKSVSRVGGKTQLPAMRALSEPLRLTYAQFLELELFTRIEGSTDEATKKVLERGRRMRAAMVQPVHAPLSAAEEIALLVALEDGVLDDVRVEAVATFRDRIASLFANRAPALRERLDRGDALGSDERKALAAELRTLVSGLATERTEGTP